MEGLRERWAQTVPRTKDKDYIQLGVITWQLSRLCFDQAGSLFEQDGEFQTKTCLSRGLLLNERHSLGDINRGPFKSEKDYYEAHISAFLKHVKYLQLGHHCFFAPIPARSEYDDYACEPMSLLSIRGWWVRYVAMWDTTLQQLFNKVPMLESCIDKD